MRRTFSVGQPLGRSLTFHIYEHFNHWSLGISLTTYNISLALGPLWFCIYWRRFP